MHKILLIDLDGVLRLWPRDVDREIELSVGLPTGVIARTAFSKALVAPAITGQCSDEQWRSAIVLELTKLTDSATAAEAVRRWSVSCGKLNKPCFKLLEAVIPDVAVALVTNATSRLDADLHALGIHHAFSAIFNSFELGVAKPDPRFFETVLKQLRVAPDSCLYIDDSSSHVNIARQLGIESHLFDGIDDMRVFLEVAGVLVTRDSV